MTKATTKKQAVNRVKAKRKKPPGGEALRQRLTHLWRRWDDELKMRLEAPPEDESEPPFTNLDVLLIVSERDFPNGRELGLVSWDAYQDALKIQKNLVKKLEHLADRALSRQIARAVSAYGAARERAGYRGAQLEMLVADHVANWKAGEAGSSAKSTTGKRRLALIKKYVTENSLTSLLPGSIAADVRHRDKINGIVKNLGSVDRKQLERELVKVFEEIRAAALVSCIARLNRRDQVVDTLLDEHRGLLETQLVAGGVSVPKTENQFRKVLKAALSEISLS